MRALSLFRRCILLALLLCVCSCYSSSSPSSPSAPANDKEDTTKFPKVITLSYELISSSATPQSVKPLCTIFYDPRTLRYKFSSWTPPTEDKNSTSTSQLVRILLPNGSSTVTTLATFATNNLSQDITLWVSSLDQQQADGDETKQDGGDIISASISSTSPPPPTAEEERIRKKIERAKARGKPIPSAKPRSKKPKQSAKPTSAKSKKSKKFEKEPDIGEILHKIESKNTPKVTVTLIPEAKAGPTVKLGSRAPLQVDADGKEVVPQQQQEKTFFQKYWWVFLAASVLVMGAGGGDK